MIRSVRLGLIGLPWPFPLPWIRRPGKREGRTAIDRSGVDVGADARFGGGDDQPGEWVTVYWAGGFEEAHIVRGALVADGIPVLLRGESPTFGSSALVGVKVQVPEALEARARSVLEDDLEEDLP